MFNLQPWITLRRVVSETRLFKVDCALIVQHVYVMHEFIHPQYTVQSLHPWVTAPNQAGALTSKSGPAAKRTSESSKESAEAGENETGNCILQYSESVFRAKHIYTYKESEERKSKKHLKKKQVAVGWCNLRSMNRLIILLVCSDCSTVSGQF